MKLQELLAANQPLAMVYVLKEGLKGIWYAPSVWEGWRRWRSWMRQGEGKAGWRRCNDLVEIYQKYMGIWRVQTTRCNNECAGRVNNKIKVIKRMAYGFRDSEYFF